MKKFLLICYMLLFLCSCTQGPVTEDNIPPNNSYEKDSASADAEEINITSMLSLQQDQSYVVCDYFEGNVLILISDSSKQNSNDITDQATTVFFEEFVVLNIQTQSIINRYPIQEFGICPSAIQAFGGVVYPFFSVGTNQMDSSIIFIDSSGKTVIYHGEFTPFSTGPVLHRYQDCLLFSFFNYKNNTFGISRIDSKFDVAPVLTFEASDCDYISDDFSVSNDHYVYAVGEKSSVTFYIGNDLDDLSTTKVSLPQNEKIHGFSLTDDTLFVSVAAKTSEEDQQNPYIESFDLETGKSIKKRSLSAPLYSITTNDSDQLCGFSVSIFKMYSIKEPLEEIRLGDTLIHGEFYKIFPDKDSFLIVIYGFDDPPEFWKVIAK